MVQYKVIVQRGDIQVPLLAAETELGNIFLPQAVVSIQNNVIQQLEGKLNIKPNIDKGDKTVKEQIKALVGKEVKNKKDVKKKKNT